LPTLPEDRAACAHLRESKADNGRLSFAGGDMENKPAPPRLRRSGKRRILRRLSESGGGSKCCKRSGD
jgi:hypothetical protein